MSADTDLTAQLAQLILTSQPNAAAIAQAREGVTDFVASTLPIARGAIADSGLPALKRVFPGNDSQTRSLLLGYMGHALDFDDFHAGMRGHPATVILPALLALSGDLADVSAERFLAAYAIGVETAGRLGLAAGPRHYTQGYHNTATLGAIAAAAAAARLAGADVEQTRHAVGLAATQAAGLRAQFGTAVKQLHAGLAARAGLSAAQLALAGFAGKTHGVLEAFLTAHGDGRQQPQRLTADWGAPWRIVAPGLDFKRYATCSGTHSAAEAAFILREQLGEGPADIESIVVSFPPGGDTATFVRQPANGIDARFSLEYVIAAALLEGELRLERFIEGPVDAHIAALADKVTRQDDPSAPPDEENPDNRFHRVTLTLRDGRTLSVTETRKQTAARNTDVEAKLRQSLSLTPQLDAEQVARRCRLNDDADVRALLTLLID